MGQSTLSPLVSSSIPMASNTPFADISHIFIPSALQPIWHPIWMWMLQIEWENSEALSSNLLLPRSINQHKSSNQKHGSHLGTSLSLPHLPFAILLTSLVNSTSKIVTESYIFTYQLCFIIFFCLDHYNSTWICVPTFTLVTLPHKFLIPIRIC